MNPSMRTGIMGLVIYLVAVGLMTLSTPSGVTREPVAITDSDHRACNGTIWHPPGEPKAVIIVGHGVTSNQGVMAMLAKAYAVNGYETITIDYLGHGRSREKFDWQATGTQLRAWIAWAQEAYPDKPLAYLGHSMGGVAGFTALPTIDAEIPFVSLGMLPRGDTWPPGPVLLAMGRFEQLFTPEQARARAAEAPEGKATALVSPYSDHSFEPLDPVLVQGMIDWADQALGVPGGSKYPLRHWFFSVIAVPLGMLGNLMLAVGIVAQMRRPRMDIAPRDRTRAWSVNPYRLAARLLGGTGHDGRPVAGPFPPAVGRGILFGVLCVVTLSYLLTTDLFTSRIDHPERFRLWMILLPLFFLFFYIDARALESVPHPSPWRQLFTAILVRVVPLVVISLGMQLAGPGIGFMGMMIGILGFLTLMMSIVYTLAVHATNDYRAGAAACAVIFGWNIIYWFPLQV